MSKSINPKGKVSHGSRRNKNKKWKGRVVEKS
jgi:hypothetical protein